MFEFEMLARGYYRPEQLAITYQPSLRMPRTLEIEQWIDALWEQKLVQARRNQTRLFDAPLFRLVDLSSSPTQLSLVLGDTSYKEYVTTRVPEFAQNHVRSNLGNALSVCSVVETSDQYILLDRRQGVDVYVGRYHVIGGFFERERDMETFPDPFAAMRREIREETGIQSTDILAQHCLGAVYDLATPHAELCFLTRLNIPLAVVQRERTPEDDEVKQLLSLHVTAESLRDFILRHHGNISATGEPNLLMYGALLFGETWFAELLSQL
jgi:8-oxo-dGTP pyrophosphatase MutT (NUDIX family)